MRVFNLNKTKVPEIIEKIDTVITMATVRGEAVSKGTRNEIKSILEQYLLNDVFTESNDSGGGYVLYEEALAAVENEKHSQQKIVEELVASCKKSNAARTTISGKRPDGYIFEISVQKAGVTPYDEFSPDQIDVIRKHFTEYLCNNIKASSKSFLDIVNVCLAKQGKAEYSDIEDFIKKNI